MKRSTARILLLCLIFFIWLTDCAGQQPSKPVRYTTIITTVVRTKTKGILLEVSDSSVLIYSRKVEMRIPASTINKIKIKRTAAAGRGALIGGFTGLIAGAIGGFAMGDDDPCPPGGSWFCDPVTAEEKALGFGILFSFGGALIGTIIGSASHVEVVMINGDQTIFQNSANKIRQYATQQRQED